MIASFGDRATRDLFDAVDSKAARAIPKAVWPVAKRKLDALDAAVDLATLTTPGNRLEKLKGDLAGCYAIRVNDQYRVVFRFKDGVARGVKVTDYH